jgi:PhoH-like ATPase
MHDPAALFRFDEHDIHLPIVVLEELDAGKKGMSEAARNVRQVSRFIDQMIHGADKSRIDHGSGSPSGPAYSAVTTHVSRPALRTTASWRSLIVKAFGSNPRSRRMYSRNMYRAIAYA